MGEKTSVYIELEKKEGEAMERLMSVEPRISLEFLRQIDHRNAVQLCRTSREFRRMCNSPQGREIMRVKEAAEAFAIYANHLVSYFNWGLIWIVLWRGKNIYFFSSFNKRATLLNVQDMDEAQTERLQAIIQRSYARYNATTDGLYVKPTEELFQECIRDPRLMLAAVKVVSYGTQGNSTQANDMQKTLARSLAFSDSSSAFCELVQMRRFKLIPNDGTMQYLLVLSWKRWIMYWRRGDSKKIRLHTTDSRWDHETVYVFRQLWAPQKRMT